MNWAELLTAAVGGGFVVKIVEFLYAEFRRRSDSERSAKEFVDTHLDPLLKAADEAVGKLRSLAADDFKSFRSSHGSERHMGNKDYSGLLFVLAKLWATMEIIRQEGLAVSIAKDIRGQRLQNLFDCMESRRVRLIDRISQRAVGELMLVRQDGKLRTIPFIAFAKMMEAEAGARHWVTPLTRVLSRAHHTAERQRLLQYGVVVHALIDALDPEHEVTRDRPSYPEKLSKRSWRDLKYRVFGRYLKFIEWPEKYLGPPKGGPKKRRRREKTLVPS